MKKNNIGYFISIILTSLICLAGMVLEIIVITKQKNFDIASYLAVIIYFGCIYYVVQGYKKPHGNLVKYLFWGYGFTLVARAISYASFSIVSSYLFGLAAILVCYSSGKLNRFKQNAVIGGVVFMLLLAGYIVSVCVVSKDDRLIVAAYCAYIIQWAVMLGTYLLRYKLHKEAGQNK